MVALSAALLDLTIGLGDGIVMLYLSSSSTSKPCIIHESPTDPIAALRVKEPSSPSCKLVASGDSGRKYITEFQGGVCGNVLEIFELVEGYALRNGGKLFLGATSGLNLM